MLFLRKIVKNTVIVWIAVETNQEISKNELTVFIQFGKRLMAKNLLLVLGLFLIGNQSVFGQFDMVIRGGGGGFSRSVSVSNENGQKVTRVTENGKKFVIREGDQLIEVEFANTYGPKDMEKLKEKHPDLHMHVTSFPKKTGEAAVEISIDVKEKVSAANESELKEKNEDAFKIFEKYTKKGGARRIPRGFGDAIRGIDLAAPPIKLIELDKEAAKRIEEMKKRFEGRGGPLFAVPKSKEEKDKTEDEKKDEGKTPKKKKDLIDA